MCHVHIYSSMWPLIMRVIIHVITVHTCYHCIQLFHIIKLLHEFNTLFKTIIHAIFLCTHWMYFLFVLFPPYFFVLPPVTPFLGETYWVFQNPPLDIYCMVSKTIAKA